MLIAQSDYRGWDAVEMARLVRERQITAADLAETALARIDDLRALNAVADLADGAQAGPATRRPGRRGRAGRGPVRGQGAAGLAGLAVDDGFAAHGD